MNNIEQAIEIAKKDLRACYKENGIQTGSRKVYWSWDSFFASFGSLEIGDFDVVKKNLQLYLNYQNAAGNIPKRIANPLYPLRYLKIPISENPKKQRPNYSGPYYTGKSLAQCPVFIIGFYQYVKKAGDKKFLRLNYKKLKLIIEFLSQHTYHDGLLRESFGGGWAESVLKRGAITYTNVCYAESLNLMRKMALMVGKSADAKNYHQCYLKVKDSLDKKLWHDNNGEFYSDWYGFSRHHYFTSDGNMLAILWNIADDKKTIKINMQINKLLKEAKYPLPLTTDRYYFWRIYFANQIGGIKNYHVRFSWLWLGCVAALVKLKIGEKAAATKILRAIADAIVKNGSVHEIYKNGKPVHLLFYKSETPWAWGAGLFIYACKQAGFRVKG